MDRNGIILTFYLILLSILIATDVDGAPDNSTTANTVVQSLTPRNDSDHKPEEVGKSNEKTTTDPSKVDQSNAKVLNTSDSASPPPPPPPTAATAAAAAKDTNGTTDKTVPPPPPSNSDEDKDSKKSSNDSNGDVVTPSPPPPPPPPPPPSDDNKDNKKNYVPKVADKSEKQTVSSVFDVHQNCTGIPCRDEGKLVACVGSSRIGSKKLVVLVHNDGEEALEVNLDISSSAKNLLKKLKLAQNQTEEINVPLAVSRNTKLILHAGHGECVLDLNPSVSEGTHFLRFPSYDKLVTPINGAYFLILSVVIFGGTWACCMFRKRGRQGGVPYQELEMASAETVSAVDVETAEGWDQGWDDDWDEDNAVKSPGGRHIGSISANGLTSRSSNREGWENDWDD